MNLKQHNLYETYASTQAIECPGEEEFGALRAYFGKFLPREKRAEILDVGCGSGNFLVWLHSLGYEGAVGVDVSEEQIERGKGLGIKNLILGDAREFLRENQNRFDVIFARDFLEHFTKEETLELMTLVRESLKYGGFFMGQTLNGESLLAGRLFYGDLTHETAFTWRSVRQLCLAAGFSKIETYPQRPVIKGIKSFVRYCIWMGIETCLRIYLLAATGAGKGIFTQDILFKAEKKW
ncbi:MAG: class I SAM-dependent methyltransferase [Nanoarchaeota archaeon]|nr:class I SAM-dependent methyltransferase [Nanoarchaeota archaeon]